MHTIYAFLNLYRWLCNWNEKRTKIIEKDADIGQNYEKSGRCFDKWIKTYFKTYKNDGKDERQRKDVHRSPRFERDFERRRRPILSLYLFGERRSCLFGAIQNGKREKIKMGLGTHADRGRPYKTFLKSFLELKKVYAHIGVSQTCTKTITYIVVMLLNTVFKTLGQFLNSRKSAVLRYQGKFACANTLVCLSQWNQIGRFFAFWATFSSLWQQLICPNLSHS